MQWQPLPFPAPGGWQTICWSLCLSLPIMAIAALGYVSLFSMLVGFVFWYRGLAVGGITAVGQLQLLQPLLGLMLSALLLHESVSPVMWLTAGGIIACVAGAKRFA